MSIKKDIVKILTKHHASVKDAEESLVDLRWMVLTTPIPEEASIAHSLLKQATIINLQKYDSIERWRGK